MGGHGGGGGAGRPGHPGGPGGPMGPIGPIHPGVPGNPRHPGRPGGPMHPGCPGGPGCGHGTGIGTGTGHGGGGGGGGGAQHVGSQIGAHIDGHPYPQGLASRFSLSSKRQESKLNYTCWTTSEDTLSTSFKGACDINSYESALDGGQVIIPLGQSDSYQLICCMLMPQGKIQAEFSTPYLKKKVIKVIYRLSCYHGMRQSCQQCQYFVRFSRNPSESNSQSPQCKKKSVYMAKSCPC